MTTPGRPATDSADIMIVPAPGPAAGAPSDQISLIELGTAVLRRRWMIARAVLWTGLVIGLLVWGKSPSYTTLTAFTTQTPGSSSSSLAGFSGIAAQFGVSVPSGSGGASPDLYVMLLQSPDFLRPVVLDRYAFMDTDRNKQDATLIDLWEIEEESHGRAIDTAVKTLLGSLAITDNTTTGVVSVGVTTAWPQLSSLVARKILSLVDSFNLSLRQQQATAIAGFTDARLEQAQQELHAAEGALARFLETNRNFAGAPRLMLERDRLQRVVTQKQGVYMTLVQTYEQARIDAVRNTPSIVVVQPPLAPLVADGKKLKVKILAALIAGGIIGVVIALVAHLAQQEAPQHPEEIGALRAVVAEMKQELRGLPRRLLGGRRRATAR